MIPEYGLMVAIFLSRPCPDETKPAPFFFEKIFLISNERVFVFYDASEYQLSA